MSILITICARGGSKGIPGKNTRLLGSLPLIAYTIRTAQKFSASIDEQVDIGLSTDSDEILKVANDYGISTKYRRPAILATDTAGKLDAIQNLLIFEEEKNQRQYDYVIDLDVTSPLRTVEDLIASLAALKGNVNAYNIFSVNKANRNPYFNMVEQNEEGYYSLSKESNFLTRQSAPPVYELNASIYIYRRSFFSMGLATAISSKSLIYVIPHICFDLDHPLDFEIIEYLFQYNKLDFEI